MNTQRKPSSPIQVALRGANQQRIRSNNARVVQPTVAAVQPKKTPAAPPVYRPQPPPRVLQTKSAIANRLHDPTNCGPACDPHSSHSAAQPKSLDKSQSARRPTGPPRHDQPPTPKCLQLKSNSRSARQAKSTPAFFATGTSARTAQGILQMKKSGTAANVAGATNGRGPAQSPMRGNPSGRSSVIQCWIQWDSNKSKFYRDGDRPGGHSNLGVLEKILKDIIKKGALTDPEDELLSLTTKFGTVKGKAKRIKDKKLLSGQGFAICHKIPYAAFEKALLKLINKSYKHGVNTYSTAWNDLEDLLNVLYGTHHGNYNHKGPLETAVTNQSHGDTVTQANSLLSAFDKCDENLYVGFSMTNSSIGENVDLHFPVLTTKIDVVTATPRGEGLQAALNQLERRLGLSTTGPVEYADSTNVGWTASSSVYGKISKDTGYVNTW
jgi:hypothetical protein